MPSTDRTTNLDVAVTGDLSLDEMERVISMRTYEPAWVHELGQHLGPAVERRLVNDSS